MTTYTTIPNSDVDQDSPVTQPLMTALRDNPIAIVEGATGAPRMSLGFLPEIAAGDEIKVAMDTDFVVGGSPTLIFRCGIFQTGSVRIKVNLSSAVSTQIYANSSASGGTTIYNSPSSAAISVDYTITDPRIIEVYVNGSVTVTSVYIGTTGAFILPFSGYNIDAVFGPT